jgi:hypothetical protein
MKLNFHVGAERGITIGGDERVIAVDEALVPALAKPHEQMSPVLFLGITQGINLRAPLIHRIFKGFVLNSYGNFPSDVV